MHKHATMNRFYRLVWNEVLFAWVPAAEITRRHRKRSGNAGRAAIAMLALTGFGAQAQDVAPTQLPTGGNVVAGDAQIAAGAAVLNIDQSSARAAIDWNTFDIGSAAQVNFNQPGSDSAILNRVLDSNPSRIFGNITADGQVFLSNPNGVYFGATASVDVGGLAATTHSIETADFMSGNITLERNGATGSVVNDGELHASLGGYIALLAPEVRNNGVVVARLGTVAMAAGESITLSFDGRHLASITTEPSAIATLVENRAAVMAPGGYIILSAKAVDSLQGGVVRNTGTLEATGLAMRDGRIVLEASSVVESRGTINANSGADGSPAGSIELRSGGEVLLAGTVSAAAAGAHAGVGDSVDASANGGAVSIVAGGDVILRDALIDVSATGQAHSPGSGGQGGSIAVTGDRIGLFDSSRADASGATGGGDVRIGGGFHGEDPSLANARQVVIGGNASIDASATQSGDGGLVAVWSDDRTTFSGSITARGGASAGDGGFVEVSGKETLAFTGMVDAGASNGSGGTLLLDPKNVTVDTAGGAALEDVDQFSDSPSADSVIAPTTITAVTNTGTAVTLQANNDLTINSAIVSNNPGGNGGNLTFQAGRSITVNATVHSDSGNVTFIANDQTAIGADRDPGLAVFRNNSLIDAGSGAVAITLGTQGESGEIATGQVTAASLAITHNGATPGAISGAIDLGEVNLTADLTINANSARNVTNTLGTMILRGTTSINVGAGDVTFDRATTDLNIIGLTAGNVVLNDVNAMRFAATNLSGNLTVTTVGPLASTGAVQVAGTTNLTANNGGFGFADPYIELTNAGNDFVGAVTLNVATTGQTGTGGYATIRDANGIDIVSSNTARALTVQAGGPVNLGTIAAGTHVAVDTTGAVHLDTIAAGTHVSVSTNGSVDLETINAGTHLTVSAGDAVDLGTITVGTSLTVATSGAITDSGTITAPQQTTLTAGAAHNITLDSANNDFNSIRIVSANNVVLIDQNAINFGAFNDTSGFSSSISGNLDVTAGGQISQTRNNSSQGYSQIFVGGATTFTANHASSPINLLLGASDPFNGSTPSQQNNFVGGVTLQRSNTNTGFTNIRIRNTNANASVLSGLTDIGALTHVALRFDNAPSVTLPGMILGGTLRVFAPGVVNSAGNPGNIISQSGAIVVSGDTTLAAGSTGDIILTHADNDFSRIGVANSGARNFTLVNSSGVVLYANNYHQVLGGDLTVTAGGNITDAANNYHISGTVTFDAGDNDISFGVSSNAHMSRAVITAARNVRFDPRTSVILGDVNATGTLFMNSRNGGSLTQQAGTAVNAGGNTTFFDFTSGITLSQPNNVLGALRIHNSGNVTLRENDAITQYQAWTNGNGAVNLTTSNDQAITLDLANSFGNITITQINNGAETAGDVHIRETGDTTNGMTQGGAWTVRGRTRLDSGATSITLNNANNVLGPLQVTGATGNTNGQPSIVTIYARETETAAAITDVGGTGAWNTGNGSVRLVAFSQAGSVAGGGNIHLTNVGNVLGDLYLKATDVTITENGNITDGDSVNWHAGGTGWVTTGTTNLIVANPTGRSITLDNLTNRIGPLGLNTTGTPGTLTSVLITNNQDLTQNSVWNVGSTPVTLDARTHRIMLSDFSNVMGNITINTANGTPTSVAITENDAITQGAAWTLTGTPITLVALNGGTITLNNAANILGNLTITGGTVSITENDSITQSGAWTTTGTTTLNPTAGSIVLTNPDNVLGAIAIAGTPNAVSIFENDNITQASAWVHGSTPFVLNSGNADIVLDQAGNILGDLTLTAANATITESDTAGITDGNAWTIPGTTTLTAGAGNPIVLSANPASDFGTVSIVSASNVDIADSDDIVFDTSNISGTMTVTAGGAITQVGAITAPFLRLIGTGSASLTHTGNNVANLAAGFSGGSLGFVNSGNFLVAVIGGTSGVTIGSNDVSLRSVNGTITGLATINASSTSLNVMTGTALVVPQMSIAGAQTFTASTVSGEGIMLNGSVTSTASGAISFASPVTLGSDLTIQSSNSNVSFASTLAGATNQLNVNAGTGLVDFHGAVTALGASSDPSAALIVTSGGTRFHSTLGANNGLAIGGPVLFSDTVTLADGNVGSLFTGLVTLGRAGGMDLSGYDGLTFNNGILLQNGAATINSNNSTLTFQNAGSVSGPFDLTLDSGTAGLVGLDRMGTDLTGLTVIALNPTIPVGGISIAGSQSYTATAGSTITLNGNVTSTAPGAITFNGPINVGAAASVASDDAEILFSGTINGNHDLTVNAGSGTTTFGGAIGSVSALGDGTGAALTIAGTGEAIFTGTVQTRSGITAAGDVSFADNVTMLNGDTGSNFAGLVTTGGTSGNTISGFDGLDFNGGLAVTGGPVSVTGNGGTISFGAAVSGAQNLTLNALAADAGTVTGLEHIGVASSLTRLDVIAHTLSLPNTGLAVAGPMSFTAAAGITLNGAVGSVAAGTGQIAFNGPVTLATGSIDVNSDDADVSFSSTINGPQSLAVNAGIGTTTFGAAVGGNSALTSLTTAAGGTTVLAGGSVTTSGAQTYNDVVTLAAATTLTGVGVAFNASLDGAHTLVVNDSGTTSFGGPVGGGTALTSITTDAAGTVVVSASSVTTSGAQTFNENMTLTADTVFTGAGLTFAGIEGAHNLTAAAGSGALQVNGDIGAVTPLTSMTATGNSVAVGNVTTSGAQTYTAIGGVTLSGDLATSGSAVTITGATALGDDASIGTAGGNITFSGATSTINGAHQLVLAAGAGNVVLGGVVGGIAPLAGIDVSGNDLTLPGIATIGDANQSFVALNDITLSQSRTLNAPLTFTADSDGDGEGSFILLNGVSLTASNNSLTITAADLELQGNSTLSTGSGLMTIAATNGRDIALGGGGAPGQMTISGDELSRMSSSGGLNLISTGTGSITVNGITAGQSQNMTGTLGLIAQGTGDVNFITNASTFNSLAANAANGIINVGVNLTTTNDPIDFLTAVAVSGASTISSGGGNITFGSTLAVDNDLTLSTGNGVLTFGDHVGSDRTLTLNLGGGSVAGLGNLQSTLTGLTVNGTSGIVLPAFTINGPQVYNTGPTTVTGNLAGIGITFSNLVDVVPASGTAITIDAGTGTLSFVNLASFNAVDMSLIGDEINFERAITGSGELLLRPFSDGRNIQVGGTGAPIVGLNLTAAELAWLPIGTLTRLTIGHTGSGTLDMAGTLNAPGRPLTLNGGGGITQSGGSITSGALTLFAAANPITLNASGNAYGAVGILGAPSALTLRNTLDITQLGSAAWALGTAPVSLTGRDILLTNAGNTFGTLALSGRTVTVTEAADTSIGSVTATDNLTLTSAGAIDLGGAVSATGNATFNAAGTVTQSGGALAIGGDLNVVTTVNAGNVTIDNSGAAATTIGETRVGGNYELIASGQSVAQAAGATLQVRGDLSVTGAAIVLGGAGNLIGGTTTLPSTNTTELRQSGVITLGDRTESGNLTVISERTNRSFSSALVGGDAIVLDSAANSIGGRISVTASAPTISTGADVQTGITQAAGTSLNVTGIASFTAEASDAGSLGIDLSNSGNLFGVLQVSGTTVNVANSALGTTTLASAFATTSLTLTTAGATAQTGPLTTPSLSITAADTILLTHVANDVDSLHLDSNGHAIAFVDADGFDIAGLDAGGANVALTARGAGSITQTAALQNVGELTLNAGGAVVLDHTGNAISTLGNSTAGTGFNLFNSSGGLTVAGLVHTATGNLSVRTIGDLTLASGTALQADAGDIVASTEGAGNFINQAGAAALVAGSSGRWLVYSAAPDLAEGPRTIKDGLTSDFRHYGDTYATYAPGSVVQSGDGYIYSDAAPVVTVTAAIDGAASHVYGDSPTGSLIYAISAGLTDSEDNIGNIISGGTATYSSALANTMDAATYDITYTGGLTSGYTLIADTVGASYTVTPAVLSYVADSVSRVYGAANPVLTGSVTGFRLGQDSSILSGSGEWSATATATSDVGQYMVTGTGYSAGSNYTFAQAVGNAMALAITPASLIVTASNDARTYNGLAYSGGAGLTYSGFVNDETETVLGGALVFGGSAQGARNAATYAITASGLTATNYDITYANGTLEIGRADLAITTNDVTRAYDGTLGANGIAIATGGTQLFGGDTLNGGTFTFTNANAGDGNRTVNVGGVTVDDQNGGNNYNVSYTANTTSTIERAAIAISTSNVVRTYDGTLAANGTATVVEGSLYMNASNGGLQDSLSGGVFAFTDANAGSGNRTVSVADVAIIDGNGGGNYAVTYTANTNSTIDRAMLTFNGSIMSRDYDGTTDATLSGYSLGGLIGAETVNASLTGATFASQNAGSGIAVTISGIALSDGTNGGLASNYAIPLTAASTGTITPRLLTLDAVVNDRVYDGTTNATLQGFGLSGFVGSETVTGLHTGTATFADRNVGDDKAIAITGITLLNGLNGGLAMNYAVPSTANSSASITPAQLHVAGVIALDRVYDGTVIANLNTEAAALAGVFGADDIAIGSISGTFADRNVGVDKAIGAGTVEMSGADAGNYVLVQPSGLTASITPRTLNLTATGIDRAYDGTTGASVLLADDRLVGDELTIASVSAFLDKNAGTNKYVGVSGLTLGGQDAANYVVISGISTVANITRATLAMQVSGINRTYDGSTQASVFLTASPIGSDEIDLSYSSAAFADRNAGAGKDVSVSGITASGADAANYLVGTTGVTTADITPATLTVGAIGQSRLYDGTAQASVVLTDNRLSGDQLSIVAGNALFADPDGGTDKLITVSGIAVAGGADAGNYVLGNLTATTTAHIFGGPVAVPPPDPSTGNATLPPITPQAPAAVAPVAPAALINFTLPTGVDTIGGPGVLVSMARSSTASAAGLISVAVSAQAAAGAGFTFPLPAAIPRDGVRMSLANGAPLPAWLRYDAGSGSFSVSMLPSGALPLELRIQSGEREWAMLITIRPDQG